MSLVRAGNAMEIEPIYASYILLAVIVTSYTISTVQTFGTVNNYLADEVWYPTAAYNYLKLIFGVTPHMYIGYPNESGIQTYMNYEHPPLGKYFMALSILALGYSPVSWRLPSWILGDLIIIVGFLFGEKLYEITTKEKSKTGIPGLVAAFLIAADPTIWVVHGIALLEIYDAFFSLLSVYALISKRYLLASVSFGLAFLSMDPAIVFGIPFLWYMLKNVKSNTKRILYILVIPLVLYIEFSAPLIWYNGGLYPWFQNAVLGRAIWEFQGGHTTAFTTPSPLNWMLNPTPFDLNNNIVLTVNPVIFLLGAALTIFMLISRRKEYKMLLYVSYWAWLMYLAFIVVYFIGTTTLLCSPANCSGGRSFPWWAATFLPILDVFIAVSFLSIFRLNRSKI